MPYSEFTSGSACLCAAYAEFKNLYVKQEIAPAVKWTELGLGPNKTALFFDPLTLGSSLIQLSQDESLGCTPNDSIDQLAHICGKSRIRGGMHFRAAVAEGKTL